MEQNKPSAPMIGSNGNIFNQLAIASKALREHGLKEKSKAMTNRVYQAESYDEALSIISEYVNPVDRNEYMKNKNSHSRDFER